jgi:hypothetical protein
MAVYGGLLQFIQPSEIKAMPLWEIWFWWKALVEYQRETAPKK